NVLAGGFHGSEEPRYRADGNHHQEGRENRKVHPVGRPERQELARQTRGYRLPVGKRRNHLRSRIRVRPYRTGAGAYAPAPAVCGRSPFRHGSNRIPYQGNSTAAGRKPPRTGTTPPGSCYLCGRIANGNYKGAKGFAVSDARIRRPGAPTGMYPARLPVRTERFRPGTSPERTVHREYRSPFRSGTIRNAGGLGENCQRKKKKTAARIIIFDFRRLLSVAFAGKLRKNEPERKRRTTGTQP